MTPTEYERIHLPMSNATNAATILVQLSSGEELKFNGCSYSVDAVVVPPTPDIRASYIVTMIEGVTGNGVRKVHVRGDGSAMAIGCNGKRSFEIDPATVSSSGSDSRGEVTSASEPACGDVDWDAIGGR